MTLLSPILSKTGSRPRGGRNYLREFVVMTSYKALPSNFTNVGCRLIIARASVRSNFTLTTLRSATRSFSFSNREKERDKEIILNYCIVMRVFCVTIIDKSAIILLRYNIKSPSTFRTIQFDRISRPSYIKTKYVYDTLNFK